MIMPSEKHLVGWILLKKILTGDFKKGKTAYERCKNGRLPHFDPKYKPHEEENPFMIRGEIG
jgi:hypothetical protein